MKPFEENGTALNHEEGSYGFEPIESAEHIDLIYEDVSDVVHKGEERIFAGAATSHNAIAEAIESAHEARLDPEGMDELSQASSELMSDTNELAESFKGKLRDAAAGVEGAHTEHDEREDVQIPDLAEAVADFNAEKERKIAEEKRRAAIEKEEQVHETQHEYREASTDGNMMRLEVCCHRHFTASSIGYTQVVLKKRLGKNAKMP